MRLWTPIAAITTPEVCRVTRILKSRAWLALMTPAPVSSPTAGAINLRSSMLVLSGLVATFPLSVSISVSGERLMPASISITAIFDPRSKPVSRV